MSDRRAGDSRGPGRDEHYRKTLDNFALIGSENLHFVGYFEQADDSLVVALHNLNRQLARHAAVGEEGVLLDLGCGSGGPACAMAETAGCRVVGVDIGQAQLERARQQANRKGLAGRVRFEHGDATRLPFEARSFDAVTMVGVSSNVPDRDRLFAEATRVLGDAGRLVLADAVVNDPDWFADRANAMQVGVLRAVFASPHVGTLEEYRERMGARGLRIVHEEDLFRHATRSFDLWIDTLREREDEFVGRLGRPRYRGLSKGVRIVSDVIAGGHVSFVLLAAERTPGR